MSLNFDKKKKRLEIIDKLRALIGSEVTVYIDRPLGSKHPNHEDIIYSINYGYIKEIIALDGEYQDAYIIGIDKPLTEFTGVVLAIINRKNDDEDKLIVVKKNTNYPDEEIRKIIDFQEKYFEYEIIR